MKHITIEHASVLGLSSTQWRFWYDDRNHALVLDSYTLFERQSKRHKFRPISSWVRLNRRMSAMEAKDVPLPVRVIDEARSQFCSSLKVTGAE